MHPLCGAKAPSWGGRVAGRNGGPAAGPTGAPSSPPPKHLLRHGLTPRPLHHGATASDAADCLHANDRLRLHSRDVPRLVRQQSDRQLPTLQVPCVRRMPAAAATASTAAATTVVAAVAARATTGVQQRHCH
eukprot:3113548-Prymnesium_polylepis.1